MKDCLSKIETYEQLSVLIEKYKQFIQLSKDQQAQMQQLFFEEARQIFMK